MSMDFNSLDVIAEEVLSETEQPVLATLTMEEAWEDVLHEYDNILAIEVPVNINSLGNIRHLIERYVKIIVGSCCIRCSHMQWFLTTDAQWYSTSGRFMYNIDGYKPPEYVILLDHMKNNLPENVILLRIGFEYNRNMVDFLMMLLQIRKMWQYMYQCMHYSFLTGPVDRIKELWFYVNSHGKGYYEIRNDMFTKQTPFDNFEIDFFTRMFNEICPGRLNPNDRLKLQDDPQIQLTYWWANYVENKK